MTSARRSVSRCFRRGRGEGGERHHPYRRDGKRAGPGCCSGCGAVYLRGRWTGCTRPYAARAGECPACERIRERSPAGIPKLEGELGKRREELTGIVRNAEERECGQHPLERLIVVRK